MERRGGKRPGKTVWAASLVLGQRDSPKRTGKAREIENSLGLEATLGQPV